MPRAKRIKVAKELTAQLHTTEEAIDTALSEAAMLITTCIASRRAIRMAAMIANDVHANTLMAMQALNKAQQYMTAAHESLSTVQEKVGLGAVAIVPPEDKPDNPPQPSGVAPELMAAE